jgi:hypothetical protein
MGYDMHVTVELKSAPTEALLYALDHQFESAHHGAGSRTLEISEHVSVGNLVDAEAFVRALVLDALPDGSVIAAVTATSD